MTFERDIAEAFDRLHTRSAERTWIYGRLGYQVDGNYIIELPSQPGAVYVLLGYDGDKGRAIAQNRIGADTTQGGQRVKMKRENGQLLIREAEFLAAGGGGGSGFDHLSDLLDVDVASLMAGDSLVWSAALGKWVNGAASAVTSHALGGAFSPHTGQLQDSQALQFLKTDGSRALTNNLTVSAFVTIDGVDLDVHAGNPDAHHHRATVGNGLSIDSAQGIAFDFDTSPGLEFNASNANRLRVKIDSSMVRASTGVGVNVAHDFTGASTWTGDHTFSTDNVTFNSTVVTFNVDPQVNANINLIKSTTAYLTSRHNLYLQPGYDNNETTVVDSSAILYLNPAGAIQMANTKNFRSTTATDAPTGIDGISIFNRADVSSTYVQMNVGAIKADELFVRVFTADVERINLGEESWAKSVGKTSAGPDGSNGFALPAVNGTADVWFEDLPGLAGADLFVGESSTGAGNGDWLISRSIDMTVGLVVQKINWQAVHKITTGTLGDGTTVQQWRIKRRSGGTSTVGFPMKKGITFLDAGQIGQGIVYLSALNQDNGPFIEVGKFDHVDTSAPAYEYKARFGNLNQAAGFTEEVYGLAAGNDLGENPAMGGFTGFTLAFDATDSTKNGLRLFNSDINIFDGSDLVVSFNKDRGIRLQHDSGQFDNEYTILQWFDDVNVDSTRRAQISSYQNGSIIDPLLYIGSFPDTDGFSTVILAATSPGDLSNGQPAVLTLVSGTSGYATLQTGTVVNLVAPAINLQGHTTTAYGAGAGGTPVSVFNVHESSSHTDDSAGMTVMQSSSGDAVLHWKLYGGQTFTAGIDNSTFADVWKLSAGNSLGTNDYIIINPDTGVVTINGLDLGSGTGITGLSGGDGITISGVTISVDSSVVRTGRTLTAGSGLTGGGDLTTNRSFAINLATVSGLSLAGGTLALSDSVAGNGLDITGKILFVGAGDGIAVGTNDVSVDSSVVRTGRRITTGGGLTGGGDLSTDRTLNIGGGNGLAVSPGLLEVFLGTNSALSFASGGLVVDSSIAGTGLTMTSGILSVKLPASSGLVTDSTGLYVRLPGASGLLKDATGLYINDGIAGAGLTIDGSKVLAVGQGAGLSVTANAVAIALGTNSGLNTTSGLVVDAAIAGAGLTFTAPHVDVIALSTGGLLVNPDNIQIKLPTPSGLVTDATGLFISDNLAGNGLGISAKVLSVNTSNGLEIVTNNVRVNQAFGFSWTGNSTWGGTSTFNSTFTLATDLNFSGAHSVASNGSNAITLAPGGDLVLSPASGLTSIANSGEFRTVSFNDAPTGITGFRMLDQGGNVRQLTTSVIKVDELTARAFVADAVRIRMGEQLWAKSAGLVESPFVLPAINATVDVWFEDTAGLAAAPIFKAGDWIQFDVIDWNVSSAIVRVYFQVVDGDSTGTNDWLSHQAQTASGVTPAHVARQQWRLKRMAGGTTSQNIGKGMEAVDLGTTGQGLIYLSALGVDGGPFIELGEFTSTVGNIPQFTYHQRTGNLNGLLSNTGGYASATWGQIAGNDITASVDTFSGYTVDSVNGLRLFNGEIDLYNGGVKWVKMSKDEGLRFRLDNYVSPERTISWLTNVDTTVALGTNPIGIVQSGVYDTNQVTYNLNAYSPTTVGRSLINMVSAVTGGATVRFQMDTQAGGSILLGTAFPTGGGATVTIAESNSSTSGAGLMIVQSGSGDAVLHFGIGGTTHFTMGIDNSDGDKFKIAADTSFGSSATEKFSMDTDGVVTLSGPLAGFHDAVLLVASDGAETGIMGLTTALSLDGNITAHGTVNINSVSTGAVNIALGGGATNIGGAASITGPLAVTGASSGITVPIRNGIQGQPISMLNNTAQNLQTGATEGVYLLWCELQSFQAMISYRALSSPWANIISQPSNKIEASTAVLTGTTGTVGKITFSATVSNGIYVENRSGSSLTRLRLLRLA